MSASASGMTVPQGQHPPYATITPDDHSAWVIISCALGLALTFLFAAIRVFVRTTINGEFGMDDYLVAAGTLLVLVQSIVVLNASAEGLGLASSLLSTDGSILVQKLSYASNLLYVLPLTLSKTAMTVFLLRLTPVKSHRRYLNGLLCVTVVWGAAFVIAIALSCDTAHPTIRLGGRCSAYSLRWQLFEALGCLFEGGVFLLAVWLVWDLQTSIGNKAVVVGAFSFRLGNVIIPSLRLSNHGIADPTQDAIVTAHAAAWASLELNYSLISATIPVLRPFINNLSTSFGVGQNSSGNGYGGYSVGSGVQPDEHRRQIRTTAFEMAPIGRIPRSDWDGEVTGRSDGMCFSTAQAIGKPSASQDASGIHCGDDGISMESNDSQKMIITKEVTWQVKRN